MRREHAVKSDGPLFSRAWAHFAITLFMVEIIGYQNTVFTQIQFFGTIWSQYGSFFFLYPKSDWAPFLLSNYGILFMLCIKSSELINKM